MKLTKRILLLVVMTITMVLLIGCNNNNEEPLVKQFNVEFISDDVLIETKVVNEGELVIEPEEPIKEGYEFKGWLLNNELFKFTETPVTSNLTLIAKWEEEIIPIIEYIVTFNTNGGTNIDSQKVEAGSKVVKPLDPIKDGYEFKGWLLNDELYNFDNEVTSNLELVASWEEIVIPVVQHKVTFIKTNEDILLEVLVDDGSSIGEIDDISIDGEIFEGFYLDQDLEIEFDLDTPITKDINVYASFYLTLPKAKELALKLNHNEVSSLEYYVKGIVKNIDNLEYGNMTITDGENDFYVYGVFSKDGSKRYSELELKPVVGDTVFLKGPFKNFNGNVELNNSKLIKFTEEEIVIPDIEDYEELTALEARNKPVGTNVLVEGVVALITYANGFSPNGIYLVDNTNALYIYSNEIASSVEVGDKVRVVGTRTNFILETEKGFAERHGYEGAIQIDQARLVSREKANLDFDKSWISEKTIREIMKTDHKHENITGTIFKTIAYINKVPGTGFTNYYFNDVDNITGSYTYTMNNGNDFSWLDKYDGELREVYLSVINARSNAQGVLYRFVPIAIGDIVEYDSNYNAEFIVKYFAEDQFALTYEAGFSPDMELLTSVDFELHNILNASLSYSSSNEDVIYFEEINNKLIFKTNNPGIAIITITGKDGENTFSLEIEIEVLTPEEVETITVEAAINQEDETIVYLEGIVGPSLVNQSGFYLFDETGFIAVRMSRDELALLNQGNKIIVYGNKTHVGIKDDAVGQIVVDDAKVHLNMFGNHEYETSFFVEGKTLSDLVDLDKMEEHSTTGYIVELTIVLNEKPYYSNYNVKDGDTSLNVYSSNAGQLEFLRQFAGERVTVEFALVNWNGNKYAASILAVITEDGKVINNSNFS